MFPGVEGQKEVMAAFGGATDSLRKTRYIYMNTLVLWETHKTIAYYIIFEYRTSMLDI